MCVCVKLIQMHMQAFEDAQAGVQREALTLTDVSSPDLCNSQQAVTPCRVEGR